MGRLGLGWLGRLGWLRLGVGRLRLLELLGWVLVGSDFEERGGDCGIPGGSTAPAHWRIDQQRICPNPAV